MDFDAELILCKLLDCGMDLLTACGLFSDPLIAFLVPGLFVDCFIVPVTASLILKLLLNVLSHVCASPIFCLLWASDLVGDCCDCLHDLLPVSRLLLPCMSA